MSGSHRLVVDRPEDVTAALASPQLSVAAPGPPHGAAARLLSRMARFSDGGDHRRRRASAETALPSTDGMEAAVAAQVERMLRSRTAPSDFMPLARTLPVRTLAAALGAGSRELDRLVSLTAVLCDALALGATSAGFGSEADAAATEMAALLRRLGTGGDDQVAAAAGVLFQARDATAALIGCALLDVDHDGVHPDAGRAVELALRRHAPVRCTRRLAVRDVAIGAVAVPRGSTVWVSLAWEQDEEAGVPSTFGSGPHRCPSAALAIALATGAVRGLGAAGWRPVPGQAVDHEPRPNLRLPRRAMVERR